MSTHTGVRLAAFVAILAMVSLTAGPAAGGPGSGGPGDSGGPPDGGAAEYWSAQRRAAAEPRDLVIDHRGRAYVRRADGSLDPYGHRVAAEQGPVRAVPTAKPSGVGGGGSGGGTTDTAGPTVEGMNPANETIGSAHTFSAVVTDDGSGVKSVTFEIISPTQQTYSFAASGSGDTWSVSLQNFSDGNWTWRVVAKDNAKRGGNTTTTDLVAFAVDTTPDDGGGDTGGGDGSVVTNAEWAGGETVRKAAGRIYFEMPANRPQSRWNGYVCSGTVVTDDLTGRSVILTAAHCVYDDVYKVFARNVLFIPNQAATSGSGTDLNCNNDPLGCWEPDFGVVDTDWTTHTFPDNIPWDYAYYVVADPGHTGAGDDTALDAAAGSLPIQFSTPATGALTHALGYSYSDDPNFMYCAEAMGTEGSANWWLPSCELSGGSSGGPWIQPMTESTGSGPIISVNSWGYTSSPGMAGPKLSGTSAQCLFDAAKAGVFEQISDRGIATC